MMELIKKIVIIVSFVPSFVRPFDRSIERERLWARSRKQRARIIVV